MFKREPGNKKHEFREPAKPSSVKFVFQNLYVTRKAYSLLFTSKQFRSAKAWVSLFTKVSSPLRSHTRGS